MNSFTNAFLFTPLNKRFNAQYQFYTYKMICFRLRGITKHDNCKFYNELDRVHLSLVCVRIFVESFSDGKRNIELYENFGRWCSREQNWYQNLWRTVCLSSVEVNWVPPVEKAWSRGTGTKKKKNIVINGSCHILHNLRWNSR